MSIKIKPIEKFKNGFIMPKKGTEQSACYDCYAYEVKEKKGGHVLMYNLGFACEIPEGYHVEIYPRSSVYKTGLRMCNSIGIIDSDYRGTVYASFYRGRDAEPYVVGDRVCQMRLVRDEKCSLELVDKISETVRGEGGHGSTGLR